MARYTMAQVSGKLLAIRQQLEAGNSTAQACKAAGLSSGTYKKWQQKYAKLILPLFVRPVPTSGLFLFSQDGRRLVVIEQANGGYGMTSVETTQGAEQAHCSVEHAAQHGGRYRSGGWPEVIAANINREGNEVLFLVDDGTLFHWDMAGNVCRACKRRVHKRGLDLTGRASSGARQWSKAAISFDLNYVAYWSVPDPDDDDERADLCVMRCHDGAQIMERELEGVAFIPPPITFHPRHALVAIVPGDNCITLIDFEKDELVLADGPQGHYISFGPDHSLLFDDMYGFTQELDYESGESRKLTKGWGSQASLSDRFVIASETDIHVLSTRGKKRNLHIAFDRIEDFALSLDGSRLAARTDLLCVWATDSPR